MAKSLIYTANTASNLVSVDSVIPLGSTVRRFGCNIKQESNAIILNGAGYYDIRISATVAPTAAGTVTISAYNNGIPITGAAASTETTAATQETNLAINAVVRVNCPCNEGMITVILSGAESTVSNIAVVVEKV